jgi:AcrR family transcriptional regulator
MIAERGVRDLRLEAVAAEAGVPPDELNRHFLSELALIEEAFGLVDHRASQLIGEELHGVRGRERLVRMLTLYIDDEDPVIRQDWVFWMEMESAAVFDEGIRRIVAEHEAAWNNLIASLIGVGQSDGSISKETEPDRAAARIAMLQDGIGRLWTMGLMTQDRAREEIAIAIDRELGPAG